MKIADLVLTNNHRYNCLIQVSEWLFFNTKSLTWGIIWYNCLIQVSEWLLRDILLAPICKEFHSRHSNPVILKWKIKGTSIYQLDKIEQIILIPVLLFYCLYISELLLWLLDKPPWSWSYGSLTYNYMCNQCLLPLKLWVYRFTACDYTFGIVSLFLYWCVCW
jgi:hypothetical protein